MCITQTIKDHILYNFLKIWKKCSSGLNGGNNISLIIKYLEPIQKKERDKLEKFFPYQRMNEFKLSIDHECGLDEPSYDFQLNQY